MPLSECRLCERQTEHEPFLTGGTDWEYGVPGTFAMRRCTACGMVAMDPMPSLPEILTYYPADYHGYQQPTSGITRWLITRNLRKRAERYRRLIGPTGRILDVGAADGAHFEVWKTEGDWELAGFEFNDAAAADGRRHGRDVATATIETYDPSGRRFNLIIMNHLLEHVTDPLDTVRRAFALLQPGGVLVGEVPNIHSWDFFVFRRLWGGSHWPRHVHQFTPRTLQPTLEAAGFGDIRILPLLHTGHWALSVQNALQTQALTRTRLRNGRAWYYALLLVLFVPLNALQLLLGLTGIIGFEARKPKHV